MKNLTLWQIELWPWDAVLIYWAVAAIRVKPTKSTEPLIVRVFTLILVIVAFWMLFSDRFRVGMLGKRFLPLDHTIQVAGVLLTYLGFALAIWARANLGQYWSARVTLKVDHQLIRSGPYSSIRHPIYTGLLLAVLGTALVIGEWRGLVAVIIVSVTHVLKAKREESLLTGELGEPYRQYQRQTGFLLPRL